MPQWYDVKYAYSGLHSIINPPPPNVDLFAQKPEKIDIKLVVAQKIQKHVQIEAEQQPNGPPECQFCFANYHKHKCQFYRQLKAEFQIKVYRNGNVIVCECCDYTDEEDECASNSSDDVPLKMLLETSNSNTEITMDTNDATTSTVAAVEEVSTEEPAAPKIQPGWYGKGWRRLQRKRKRVGAS